MANENKKINELVSEQDDETTAKLEVLSEEACADNEPDQQVEAESDADTFDFAKLGSEVDDADETIATLKPDLRSRAKSISTLQFDIEQLRSRWTGLEKEIRDREEATETLAAELKLAHKKQSNTETLLKQRAKEIDSLTSRLSGQQQSQEASARQIEQARNSEQESESRVLALQAQLNVAEDKLSTLTKESLAGRSVQQETSSQVRSLSGEVECLKKGLAASRASLSEQQQYIESRNADWDKQQKQLNENNKRIDQLSGELEDAATKLRDGRDNYDDLKIRLASSKSERDELLKEITQLRKAARDTGMAEADKKLLIEQTGMLAGNKFEISELKNQIARTETYADKLRRQVQDKLELTDGLETRQNHLEISLTHAEAQVRALSDGIEELRSSNAALLEKESSLKEGFDRDVRQIRFDLGEAQVTIADRESLNQQLTSDLVDSREFNINLENRISITEEENNATIEKLTKTLAEVETLKDELQDKLGNRENAISALFGELTKRSEAIASIGEIEDVIHELDDRMSESIDDRGSVQRERVTRLLIGKIDGQKLRFPLFKNRLTIGRTGHNDIQLKAECISRRHAVIVTDTDSTRIVDWGSRNGVFVNERRIKEQVLRNGDIVTIGTADFKFEERPKR